MILGYNLIKRVMNMFHFIASSLSMIEVRCAKGGSTLTVKLNDYALSVRESFLEYQTSGSN